MIEEVDGSLSKAGVRPDQFQPSRSLFERGAPIEFPPPVDFPLIGFMTQEELKPASQLIGDSDHAMFEPELDDAIAQMHKWMQVCLANKSDLVTFYY